jgi:hypothetical protein
VTNMQHAIEPEELMAYLEGELASEGAAAAADHLEHCAECHSLADDLREVTSAVKTWRVEAPANTGAKLSAALEEWEKQQRGRPNVTKGWLGQLAQIKFSRRLTPVYLGSIVAVGTLAVITLVGLNVYAPRGSTKMASVSQNRPSVIAEVRPLTSIEEQAARVNELEAKDFRLEQFTKLNLPPSAQPTSSSPTSSTPTKPVLPTGPMIIRTAGIAIIAKDFGQVRTRVEQIVAKHRGYIGSLQASGATGGGRTLQASLRIPSDQLDGALAEIKTLGRVQSESQNGQEVTAQFVDLQARLSNSRNTEQRLIDLLRERTGKLSDVLAVENELARVRGEIEQMEAERKSLLNQVSFSTLNATITEDYQAQLQVVPPSTSTRLINAAVEGYRSMVDGILSIALFLLSAAPSLILWAGILFFPARFAWKRFRRVAQ